MNRLFNIHFENLIERWKYNTEWDVEVSSFGRLRKNGEIIQPKTDTSGYLMYVLKDKKVGIHRIVASTFKPVKGWGRLTVDHLDHNKRNNSVSNLEWISEKENLKRAEEDMAPSSAIDVGKKEFPVNNQIKINGILCKSNGEAVSVLKAMPNINKDKLVKGINYILTDSGPTFLASGLTITKA